MNENKNNTDQLDATLPSITCRITMKHHHEMLIGMAKDALDRKEFELSVILATSACEMLTERAFSLLFSYRNVEYLYDSVIGRQRVYNNITNKKSRDLYIALSGDNIITKFNGWADLGKHYNRRHEIVHQGKTVDEEDAKKSLQIVNEYIKHIEAKLEESKPEKW